MDFYGNYEHSLDGRGRLAIPAVFRRGLGEGGVIRPADDGCLQLFTHEGFREEKRHWLGETGTRERADRDLLRDFFAEAFSFDLDQQGRIVISEKMRDHASLEGTVLLVGLDTFIELWNPERWQAAREAAAARAERGE